MQQNEESLYARYCRMGRRFEIGGGVTLIAAVAGHVYTGGNGLLSVLMIVGFILFIFGAMNMKPSNMIRAFAAQLSATSDPDFARGLIEAMEKNGVTALSKSSLSSLNLAINTYAASEGADEELVERLCQACKKHVRKTMF